MSDTHDVEEGTLLWEPSAVVRENANLTHYMRWLARRHGLSFDTYQALWRWSVDNIGHFWQTIWEYGDIIASQQPDQALARRAMPGAEWFPGARLNYAENIFAKMSSDGPVIHYRTEE